MVLRGARFPSVGQIAPPVLASLWCTIPFTGARLLSTSPFQDICLLGKIISEHCLHHLWCNLHLLGANENLHHLDHAWMVEKVNGLDASESERRLPVDPVLTVKLQRSTHRPHLLVTSHMLRPVVPVVSRRTFLRHVTSTIQW
jgi:hypothetical protein